MRASIRWTFLIAVALTLNVGCNLETDRDPAVPLATSLSLLSYVAQSTTSTATQSLTAGVVCGSTASFSGGAGGYETVRSLCQTACAGSSTAHLCTANEVVLNAQFGKIPSGEYWIGGFGSSGNVGAQTNGLVECNGWTSVSAVLAGSAFNTTTGPTSFLCNSTRAFLCCEFSTVAALAN